ncbi:xanthine dehydrogenase molybdopterin binding subunit [Cochlodiniinecator piscidefendens]|uniref:xanthine dehydrogenase molybdopterin binding subunit n=1 Tax=Cochlodiniinecator piscidefendens TaxID=2715756 RepID=UPI001409C50E|nr:xanthine dehydrogenase molybdopterin binding subunit [Cochlodiniinecator piscidefendens]
MSVAKSLPHDSGSLHVSGEARYIDDIPTPSGTLHLAFGLSEIACGTIDSLDLGAVRSADGVVLVWSAADLSPMPDASPSVHDEPLLSTGEVHYVGQPIFVVAADSHLAARKAVRKAEITYRKKLSIQTVEEALSADSRFEDGPRIYSKGDAKQALDDAPHRLQGQIEMGGQEHFYLEGQAALSIPQEGGEVVVHSSTQHPTEIQHKVAHALNIPMHGVRVETRRMGGGFGGKESQGNALAIATAMIASATGKPCKMRYDRDDDMMITGKRHDFQITYDVGFDDTGRIQGIDFIHYTRCGWAQDLSLPVADRAMLHADNAYHLPNARIESHRLKTNIQSATAYRGFGGPQGIIGIERVIDHIATHLKRDPLSVRRANFYTDFDETEDVQTTPYHQPITDCVINSIVDELCETSDYRTRRRAIQSWNAENPILKRGIALTPVKFGISFTLTHLNQAGALVHVYQDGSIHLNHGGTEMGQGLFQKVAQVAASRFGVDIDQVKITATDTAKVPNTSATAASSGSDLNGMAVQNACDTIRDRIAEFLAEKHKTIPFDVLFENGNVFVAGTTYSFAEAAKLAYENRVSLSATGFYKTPDIKWDRIKGEGQPFFYFAYGAAVSEVVIDTLTGENRILRTDILHDAGASLNPALDIGQIEGGFVQGAGWLTTEELVWDNRGQLRTHAPSTYKIPACSDRPDVFNVALWKGENPAATVYRSKAVGEPPFVHGASVLLALSDAIAAVGNGNEYVALDAPATAETILHAVNRQKQSA